MLQEGLYTISDLNRIIKEGNEFHPTMGANVVKDNTKNNEKAVGDIMKETGKMEKKAKTNKKEKESTVDGDWNKTTLDYDFAYDPGDEYKERVKAQVHGFPSKENEKSTDATENESLEFDGNKDFYEDQKKKSKKQSDKKTEIKQSGLAARTMPKENFKNQTIFKENKTMKRLHFKNTRFLSESQMLSKVPEDYKTDGNVFLMKDATGAEFIVECTVDDRFNFAQFKVCNKPTKEAINEEFHRMEKLYEYKSEDFNTGTTSKSRKSEDENVSAMLNIMKNLKNTK